MLHQLRFIYRLAPGVLPLYNVASSLHRSWRRLQLATVVPSSFVARDRVALFQHSVDERSSAHLARGHPTRVSFGERWLKESVLEIFQEDIARFQVVIRTRLEEDPMGVLARGEAPRLLALRLHNGTVWRWNRPCYGVLDGHGHLRIEMRALPSGPTVADEMANAAFFLGLMSALDKEYGEVSGLMPFDDAKDNFFAAARYGLKAQFMGRWQAPHGVRIDSRSPASSGAQRPTVRH